MARLRLAALAAVCIVVAPGVAAAELRVDQIEAKSIKLDGVPKEWSTLVSLSTAVKGSPKKADLEAKAAIAYDGTNLFVAADVTDDVLKPGGDHVEVVLGFPGGTTAEIELYPGDPGKSPGSAKAKDGSALSGAKVVEAPRSGGWSLEATVPWSAISAAKTVRVNLRGAIFVHDADRDGSEKNVVGTAGSAAYASLPAILMENEQALADGLLKEKNIKGAPRFNFVANVSGDVMKERVMVYERYLVVLGPTFRKGSEYYYNDLGVDPANIVSVETRDVNGDGLDEIVLHKRFGTGNKWREAMSILAFGSSETPTAIFQHEVGINTDVGSVANVVSFSADGAKQAIKITPGSAKGFNAGNYHEATETSMDPVLLPWGTIASQTYKINGSVFAKSSEEKQAATAPPPAPEAVLPKAPPPPSASELLDKVYDLYKKDRAVGGRPRFDLAVDVAGDKTVERVLMHDRNIVIFGKGFKNGTGYSFLTVQQFASSSDITDMTARDLTGDGKAEIIVKGVLHGSAPKEAGGGTVDREVVIVFQVQGDTIKRIFAAETARAIGKKRVAESFQFVSGSKGVDIEIASGKATEWTEKTYPFNKDTSAVGGFEPLILPWGAQTVRYKWSGSAYSK